MGLPVHRMGDICTGHGSFPPRPSISGSTNVFANGKPVHRVGDSWIVHCAPKQGCHPGTLAKGSSTVYVNGRPIARVGDQISCGSKCGPMASPTVFAG